MGELQVIGSSPTLMVGDTIDGELRLTWSKDNDEEVARARATFDEYLKKGWLAIGESADQKKQIFRFDPDLEKIVLAPLMMGG